MKNVLKFILGLFGKTIKNEKIVTIASLRKEFNQKLHALPTDGSMSNFAKLQCLKVIYSGAVVVDARKKLGGSVASRNRAGAFWRRRVKPVNPRSLTQIAARNRLTGLSQAWRGLTAAQRNAWNSATVNFPRRDRLGQTMILSGAQLYISLNFNLLDAGGAVISSPPTPATIVAPTSLTATVVAIGAKTLTFLPSPVTANQAYLVYATRGMSPGVSYVKSQYRLLTTFAAAAASPQVVTTAYDALFGPPVAGQKIFFKIVPVSTVSGQKGTGLTAFAIAS